MKKITINDIAEDCGISRMTFYYHFKDIYDLVEWACVEDAAQALAGKKTYDTWQEGFLNIFYAVQANKPFIMNVYHSVSRERIEQYLSPLIANLILGVVEEKAAGLEISRTDQHMKEDPADIVERTSRLMQGNVVRALQAFGTGEQPAKN